MKENFRKMKISTDELELWDRDQDADHFDDDGLEDIEDAVIYHQPSSLVDLSLGSILKATTSRQFERKLIGGCPPIMFPKLVASVLLQKRPRPLILRLLIKHWPGRVFNFEYLATKCERFAKAMEEERVRMTKLAMLVLETYFNEFGFVSATSLRSFDFVRLSRYSEFQTQLRGLLRKYFPLLVDWVKQNKDAHLKIFVMMYGEKASPFWHRFLSACPTFIKPIGITVESPISSGNKKTMKLVLKVVHTETLDELHLNGERLFNREGCYETQVDHLKELMTGMYHAEIAPWQVKLRTFEKLTALSLALPPKTPACELNGIIAKGADREIRRTSASAVQVWSSILPYLRSLKKLSLRGNYLRDKLNVLLDKVPFGLKSLNVEECGLSSKDFRYLSTSLHRYTLTELNVGDLDLGDEKFGHILGLIRIIPPQLEKVGFCMEGYERYSDNIMVNEFQGVDLLSALLKCHRHSLRQVNFGGHAWSKEVLMKMLKYLVKFPLLDNLILPTEGLSEESRGKYVDAKLGDVQCLPPPEIDKFGPEFLELKAELLAKLFEEEELRPRLAECSDTEEALSFCSSEIDVIEDEFATKVSTKALRDGMQFLIKRRPPWRPFQDEEDYQAEDEEGFKANKPIPGRNFARGRLSRRDKFENGRGVKKTDVPMMSKQEQMFDVDLRLRLEALNKEYSYDLEDIPNDNAYLAQLKQAQQEYDEQHGYDNQQHYDYQEQQHYYEEQYQDQDYTQQQNTQHQDYTQQQNAQYKDYQSQQQQSQYKTQRINLKSPQPPQQKQQPKQPHYQQQDNNITQPHQWQSQTQQQQYYQQQQQKHKK